MGVGRRRNKDVFFGFNLIKKKDGYGGTQIGIHTDLTKNCLTIFP